mmetsp:Transcript_24341/g.71980  ORF Transcript_24341/g.71980 Transcript_24341/m.71980 type:complete len:281 (-) Transcript_24341:92-934(-)
MRLYAALCTALYCACVGLQGAGVNVVGPAGPSLASKLRTDVSSVGSILSAEGAGAAAGALLIPLLLGRLPGHIVLCVLSASIGVSLCGVWLCGSIREVTILYFAVGGLLGSFSGCANTLLAWLHAGRNLGPWVNLVNACFGLGSGGVPLLFVAAERRLGDGLRVFPALGLAAAGVALSAACLPSPPRPKDAKGGGGGGGGGGAITGKSEGWRRVASSAGGWWRARWLERGRADMLRAVEHRGEALQQRASVALAGVRVRDGAHRQDGGLCTAAREAVSHE